VSEDGAFEEAEAPFARGRVLVDDLRAGNVAGHEIRRELDALEGEVQCLRQGGHKEGLGQARHTQEHRVAAGQDGDQDLFDDLVHSDNDFGEFSADLQGTVLEVIDSLVSWSVGGRVCGFAVAVLMQRFSPGLNSNKV